MSARKYQQRLRAQSAEETRRRILDTVSAQLCAAPMQRVSLDKVAREAEVSRSTIYQVFGSRGGLFDALGAEIMRTGGFDELLAAASHPDARQALRGSVDKFVRMNLAHRDALRALTSMAEVDPEAVGGAVQRLSAGQHMGIRGQVARLNAQGVLREGLDPDYAVDMLMTLLSFDSVDQLYSKRGRDTETVIAILTDMVETTLCRPLPDESD